MSAQPTTPSDRPRSRLMLVDEDSVFRSGLRVWLEQFPDLDVVAEAEDGTAALQILASYQVLDAAALAEPSEAIDGAMDRRTIDLVILDIALGQGDRNKMPGLDLCQQIKSQYPMLAVLLLSSRPEPVLLAAAQRVGANGYCPKQADVNDLVVAVRQVLSGQPVWIAVEGLEPAAQNQPAISRPNSRQSSRPSQNLSYPPSPFTLFRRNLRRSGLQQIDAALAETEALLRNVDLSDLDRAVLAGRYRELRAARWVVKRLLATPSIPDEGIGDWQGGRTGDLEEQRVNRIEDAGTGDQQLASPAALVPSGSQILASPTLAGDLQSILFDAIAAKIQGGIENGTEIPLETDILREDKKRELFYLVLRKVEELLGELRYSQVEYEQLELKRLLLLQDLWQATLIDFFGKYTTIPIDGVEVEVVNTLLQDALVVQSAILDKIPGVVDLFQHLLFQVPLVVDTVSYPPGNPEALARAEALLENLMIQMANAVIQPLLNRFANVEAIKQGFYNRRLLSNREIERFRNNLSWRYRLEMYVREPKDIFESRYSLFILSGRSIKQIAIYAPRNQELQQLSGVPLFVTLVFETRDAIAPRLRSAVSFVGNGVVYILTEVIGRGIGLIGRGILKGIGNVWQDGRYTRR